MLDEVGQHRREIAGAFQRRPGCHPQRRPEFGGDDHCQRRLAQSGRAGQQNVIRCAAAVFGALDDQLQLFTHPRLADELLQRAGPQADVDIPLADGQRGRDFAVGRVLCIVLGHRAVPSNDRAARSALDVVASWSAASTLAVASSACLTAKPRPTRASTTGLCTAWPLVAGEPATAPAGTILSRSSSTIRSAPRLPIPGTRVSAATSPSCSARRSVAASCTASVAIANRGPTPDTDSSVRNRSRVSVSGNPYNVIESSRTIIAVTSLAWLPCRSVASVD